MYQRRTRAERHPHEGSGRGTPPIGDDGDGAVVDGQGDDMKLTRDEESTWRAQSGDLVVLEPVKHRP